MTRLILLLFSSSLLAAGVAAPEAVAQEGRNLLSGTYTPDVLARIIQPPAEWYPFPRANEPEGWRLVPDRIREAQIMQAEKHLGCEWETPKASVFMEYVRTGNRTNYQNVANNRRRKLIELVLGECMEGEGRFLDDIMNGIWTICEETYWGVPAHVGLQQRGSGLPDVTEPTVDLFAAETGMMLAWTWYLVGEGLEGISTLIGERIRFEIDRRIISVNLDRNDFWWMGFEERTVNNWNPWICSNWLACVLLLEEDPDRRIASVYKILQCLDNFLNPYPSDGGCDEGPGYWGRAGGSLFDCLELLHNVSDGGIDVFDDPLIKEIGRFICRAYIHDRYFINFADAAARLNPEASLVFRYGRSIGDSAMEGFGAFLARQQGLGESYLTGSWGAFGRILPSLFSVDELLAAEPSEPLLRDLWLPELQVMGARSSEGSSEGFYIAAKGGHNAENHNHNDVGNFILYADGHPVLVDVGVETYTAKTFSGRRYEIWTMQSAWHNLPTINGVMQRNGSDFKATGIEYQADRRRAEFSLDIAGAYPEEAAVRSYRRVLILNRGRDVELRDSFELEEALEPIQLSLMSWRRPVLVEDGRIRLEAPDSHPELGSISLRYAGDEFIARIEEVPLEDSRLRSSWGDRLFRIILTGRDIRTGGEIRVRVLRER